MNTPSSRSWTSCSLRATTLATSLAAGFLALAGCHKGSQAHSVSGLTAGTVALTPNQAPGSQLAFLVASNSGGRATGVRLLGVRWGMLVDVRDQAGVLRHKDFLTSEGITSGSDYLVETNSITGKTTVTILAPFSELAESPYVTRLAALEADLAQVDDKSLEANELPPFPLVPRNAVVALQFDDLVAPATVNEHTVKVLQGYPPTIPFEARILPDPNHGDLANYDGLPGMEFYSTRILIDPSVSAIEAAESNPPLAINTLGLPASLTQAQPNIAVRIPTHTDADTGQSQLLTNPTGHVLATSSSGSVDLTTPTRDVVRAVRSGGGALGDVNNGFLLDTDAPSIIGTQAAFVQNLAAGPTPQTFVCDLAFSLPACTSRLVAGDVLQQGGVFAEVICPPFQTCPAGSFVTGTTASNVTSAVYFRILSADPFGPQEMEVGPVQVSMRYHANVPSGLASCFVRFPTVTLPPDQGVSPSSSVILRFSEPMDPNTVRPFDSFMVLRKDPATITSIGAYDLIVGDMNDSTDLREFTLSPTLPLTHLAATTESYWVQVLGGAAGAKDLSGNQLSATLPPVRFRLDSSASVQNTGCFALRFQSDDELSGVGGDTSTGGVGNPEFRGQLIFDSERQEVRPRPVTHFRGTADRTQPVMAAMVSPGTGTQTPLSRHGSKLQTLWRYCDVGFALLDEANYNVDVEGLAWSPVGAAVVADHFTRFEMSLAHSFFLPDESLRIGAPAFPLSGLVTTFTQNQLSPTTDPLRTVFPRLGGPTGYAVVPTDIYLGPTGTKFMPWPMNRGIATKDFVYYTWRDTSILAVAGPSGPGAELAITGVGTAGVPYAAGSVPTVGLPLLMEFRCYPDDAAQGLNFFEISNANAFTAPNFRAFSTGGVNSANQIVRKDPDVQTVASGGFNPASTPLPGQATAPVDNTVYLGEMNLVTRISRSHSLWFDATSATVQYAATVQEPKAAAQPAGTAVTLEYRGATQAATASLTTNASTLDAYGESANNPTFANGDATWKSSLGQLNGARFFQVRVTFLSNAETNLSPSLSSLGFSYRR